MWLTTSNVVGTIALELFESELGYRLDFAQTEAARANGALTQLRVWLHHLAHTNVLAGDLAAAAAQLDESRSISAATGNRPVGYTELALEAYRGRDAQASELIEKTSATAGPTATARSSASPITPARCSTTGSATMSWPATPRSASLSAA